MRKLKIAQIAPLWYSIPPKKYGGIERIVSFVTEELVRRNHKVTLFATKNSKTKAKLVSLVEKDVSSLGAGWGDYWWNLFNHSVAFGKANQFDIIHCHWGIMGGFLQKFTKTPVLHTFHNIPQSLDLRWRIFKYFKNDLNVVFISKSEKRNAPVKFKNNWIVYNGIDVSQFRFNPSPKDHFIWIARVSPAKGIENAIKIAEKTGIKLVLAGQIQPQWLSYFKTKIKPRLTKKIQYIGELSQEELSDFYGQAKACLYPIEWEEPFGLIMVEAMACGTPVIAFNRGSVKEVIKNGRTGFVVKNMKEMVGAIKNIDQIDRSACLKRVEDLFSYQQMVSGYEEVYQKILSRQKIK